MVWEVLEDTEVKVTYMGVWDINCWYQAQMPASVDELGHANGLCPYLSICEVNFTYLVIIK